METTKEMMGKVVENVEFVDEHDYVRKAIMILKTVGNLRLIGETGSGKTTLVYALSQKSNGVLFEIVLTRDISRWDLLACDTLKEGTTQTRKGLVVQWLEYPATEKNPAFLYIDGWNYGESGVVSLFESLADFRGNVYIPELQKTFTRTKYHYLIISYNPPEKVGYCLTEDMTITTPKGFEIIKLISKNDYVFNEHNQKDKVTDTNTRNYKGKLYTVKAKAILPIKASADHTFIVAERKLTITKNPTWTHRKNVYAYEIKEKLTKDLKAYTKEDYGITSATVDTLVFPKHKIETETKTPLDLAWLYGLFVADGSTVKSDNTKVSWCLGSHETDLIQKVKEILARNGYSFHSAEQDNETRIIVSDRKLREFVRGNFGTYAENKRIPQFIMDSPKEITKAFLEGYIDGDGSQDEKQTQIKTVSKNLILGLQRLYSKLDILVSIQTIQPKPSEMTKGYKLKPQYLGRFGKTVKMTQDKQNFYLPIVKITTEDYNGKLYDITVETIKPNRTHGTFLVNNIAISNSGTFLQNIATIRRFEGFVVDYLSITEETKVVKKYCDNYEFSRKWTEIANKTRKLYRESKLRTPLTLGNLISYAKMWKAGLDEDSLVEIASSLYPDDEQNLFKRLWEDNSKLDLETVKKKAKEEKT